MTADVSAAAAGLVERAAAAFVQSTPLAWGAGHAGPVTAAIAGWLGEDAAGQPRMRLRLA